VVNKARKLHVERPGTDCAAQLLQENVVIDLNPQAEQMASESMVRCLRAQALAIWPQEVELFRGYGVPLRARILDAGCGTGEAASRLAALFPDATVLGVDILDQHLELARRRYAHLASRLSFDHQSVYELQASDGSFDLALCRHLIHSIPYPDRVIAELVRVTRHGGYIHLIAEDYGMLHFQRGGLDLQGFWHQVSSSMGLASGIDLLIGRNSFGILMAMNLEQIRVDYIIVDTVHVPREVFAAILEAWRDGYAQPISRVMRISSESAIAHFDQMIENVRNPRGYAAWMVPVVSARVP
jgi:ubiquinone/menaquinone biosynthesis C-methylase UbiE